MADEKVVVYQNDKLAISGFAQMEEIRRHGKLCDVTLKAGDQKFSAHRIVLAATIPYFQAMFTHDMIESKQNEINMQGIEPCALEMLVNFAYSGKMQICEENVQSLLIGANFLNLYEVKESCCLFLTERFHFKNVLGIRAFGEQLVEVTITNACNSFINQHFASVASCDEFLQLSLKDLIDIISRDELNVRSEEQVFEAAMNWVKHNAELRGQFLPDIISHVRLPLITPQYLADRVSVEGLIKSSLPCRDLVDEAKDYHLMPERRKKLRSFRTQPRHCLDIVEYIVAVGGLTSSGDSVSTVEIYDPKTNKWFLSKPMRTLRSRVGVSVLNSNLYAIGGYNGVERLDTVEIFDAVEETWKVVAPLTCPRSALGSTSLNGKLYVCGGFDGLTSLDTVECYSPDTNSWSSVTRMTRRRSAAGIVSFDGHIYALGGHDGLSIFDSVECFNNLTGSWTQVCSMQSRRCRLGAAALSGKLYVAGGYDGQKFLKTCECYDPVLNIWSYVAPMAVQRSRVALVASSGKLFAIGGYDGQNNLTCVEMYNPETNQWSMAPPMAAHEGGVGVGVVTKCHIAKKKQRKSPTPVSNKPYGLGKVRVCSSTQTV